MGFRNLVRVTALLAIFALLVTLTSNGMVSLFDVKPSASRAQLQQPIQRPPLNEAYSRQDATSVPRARAPLPREHSVNVHNETAHARRTLASKSMLTGHDPNHEFQKIPDLVKLRMDDAANPFEIENPSDIHADEKWAAKFLQPGNVPGIIHFLWCGKRWFSFKNYLAVLSAIKAINPDKVIVHYQHLPQEDRVHYHQWWDNLVHDYPFVYTHKLNEKEQTACSGAIDDRLKWILAWVDFDGGGIYIGENTWLVNFPPSLRDIDVDFSITDGSIDGYIILRTGLFSKHKYNMDKLLASKKTNIKRAECATVRQLFNGQKATFTDMKCVNVLGGKYDVFTPMFIWELDNPFGRLTRKLFYGTENILKPKPSFDRLVPNIGHMIWIGGGKMDYLFYLSLLSKLYVLKVDVVYLHGDVPPTGEYWEKLKANKKIFKRVKFIARPPPYKVFNGEIQPFFRALMSDIIRVDIMIKYGGIYTDTDAIWTKTLSHEDRGYDAVASYDWVDWSYPFPDSVNFGISYGKRNAPFWRLFRNSMRTLHNDVHGFTGVMMPYKLLEKYPHLLRIDRHLQAICYRQKCHPTYVKGYHNQSNNHVTTKSIPNVYQNLNALHWTHPNPPEYANRTTLLAGKGLFADVGRNVLRSAGLL